MTPERLEWCATQVRRACEMPDSDLTLTLASYDMAELFRLARLGVWAEASFGVGDIPMRTVTAAELRAKYPPKVSRKGPPRGTVDEEIEKIAGVTTVCRKCLYTWASWEESHECAPKEGE